MPWDQSEDATSHPITRVAGTLMLVPNAGHDSGPKKNIRFMSNQSELNRDHVFLRFGRDRRFASCIYHPTCGFPLSSRKIDPVNMPSPSGTTDLALRDRLPI